MKNYRPYFRKVIQSHYAGSTLQIMEEIEGNFTAMAADYAFAKTSANPVDKRMEISAYFLATVKTLHNRQAGNEHIREILLTIANDYVQPKNRFAAAARKWMTRMMLTAPGRLLIRRLAGKTARLSHPDGFVAHLITDPAETFGLGYGVNITECGICKLFHKHNSDQYTPILCEVDNITTNLAGLTLVRTGTIANGAPQCDFRFQRQ